MGICCLPKCACYTVVCMVVTLIALIITAAVLAFLFVPRDPRIELYDPSTSSNDADKSTNVNVGAMIYRMIANNETERKLGMRLENMNYLPIKLKDVRFAVTEETYSDLEIAKVFAISLNETASDIKARSAEDIIINFVLTPNSETVQKITKLMQDEGHATLVFDGNVRVRLISLFTITVPVTFEQQINRP